MITGKDIINVTKDYIYILNRYLYFKCCSFSKSRFVK